MSDQQELPVADIKPVGPIASGRILQSKMWWITLVCLGLAGYLAWQSQRPTGFEIVIDFPEGHGLQAGDVLQHRGIDIGIVTGIELAEDLHGIRTTVEVDQSAKGVAVEDSQFWIVRPQLSLTNIRGLETAVGSKYIAVMPGTDGGNFKRDFTGLKDPPPVALDVEGVEILLRGDVSFGIKPGSLVTYRGIPVGRILSIELSKDARYVQLLAKIESEYQPLLRTGSKFWKSSGVDLRLNYTGFQMTTESLASMAQGGVAFITPQTRYDSDLQPVEPGHVFELYKEAKDSWIDNGAALEWGTSAEEAEAVYQ